MATECGAARRPEMLSSALASLPQEETSQLLGMRTGTRSFRAGQEIVSEGRYCPAVFIITDGIAIRCRILRDGQRQILNLFFRGDIAGITNCFYRNALYSIKALTRTEASWIPLRKIIELFDTRPGLAAKSLTQKSVAPGLIA
jgi:CRP-like cAMP-binding protein